MLLQHTSCPLISRLSPETAVVTETAHVPPSQGESPFPVDFCLSWMSTKLPRNSKKGDGIYSWIRKVSAGPSWAPFLPVGMTDRVKKAYSPVPWVKSISYT